MSTDKAPDPASKESSKPADHIADKSKDQPPKPTEDKPEGKSESPETIHTTTPDPHLEDIQIKQLAKLIDQQLTAAPEDKYLLLKIPSKLLAILAVILFIVGLLLNLFLF